MQQHLFNHFCISRDVGLLGDVFMIFVDKTDLSDSLKRKNYLRHTLKSMCINLVKYWRKGLLIFAYTGVWWYMYQLGLTRV